MRLVLCLLLLFSSVARAEWLDDTQAIMGTEIRVTVWHQDVNQGKAAIASVMTEMRRIDAALSPYIENSELSRINRDAAASAQNISDELRLLIERSIEVSELSAGAFDITFASVGRHYDYRKGQAPSAEQLQALLPAINYQWLELDRESSKLKFAHKNVRIDLGGIAKGYAVDQAIKILQSDFGVEHASVSAGGDSRVIGRRWDRPWVVGIKHPRPGQGSEQQAVIRLPLSDTAVSTSGDYERFFIDDNSGERIHHIINPRTGKSASELMSVTVLGARGLDTDPLSTTVFVLGTEKGLALVNKLPGIDAILIDRAGKVHYSSGLAPPQQ
jgi:thiamine biosynthesis lipoprotein